MNLPKLFWVEMGFLPPSLPAQTVPFCKLALISTAHPAGTCTFSYVKFPLFFSAVKKNNQTPLGVETGSECRQSKQP